MPRNAGDYVKYPNNIGDALYNAPTTPSATNPFVTLEDLNSAIGSNNTLAEILANGNTTGGSNIVLSNGDWITSADALTLVGTTDVDITAANEITITSTAGIVDITSAGSDVQITAGDDFIVNADTIDFNATHVNLGLTEYANNAAAVAGGLLVGETYILAATKAVTIVQ